MDGVDIQAGVSPGGAEPGDGVATVTPRDRWYRLSIGAMALVLAMFSPAAFVVLGWFTEAYQDTQAASEVSHRFHEVVFGILFTIALIGALSQWRRPGSNRAGLLQLTAVLGILTVVIAVTVGWDPGLLLYLIPLAAVLLSRPSVVQARSGPVWPMAALLTLVALPSLSDDIVGHIERARTAAQNHTTHWSAMAAFAVVLLALGVISAFRFTGYRLVACTLGVAAIGYGVAAIVFPFDASSHRTGYSIGMALWGLAWILGLRLFDRPRARSSRTILRLAAGSALALIALIAGVVWAETDSPPNVPHRPHPDQIEVVAADVDRATCLGCHQTGTAGAPIPPHDLDRVCDDGHCWGGRTDCMGCHQIDPQLGGPAEMLEAGLARSHSLSFPVGPIHRLDAGQLSAIAGLGAQP
jgi:peptidoglycan/LPS O-acetylase OafA/YrhL